MDTFLKDRLVITVLWQITQNSVTGMKSFVFHFSVQNLELIQQSDTDSDSPIRSVAKCQPGAESSEGLMGAGGPAYKYLTPRPGKFSQEARFLTTWHVLKAQHLTNSDPSENKATAVSFMTLLQKSYTSNRLHDGAFLETGYPKVTIWFSTKVRPGHEGNSHCRQGYSMGF